MLREYAAGLIGQVAGADIIEQPLNPPATLGNWHDALSADAQLLSGGPGNARAPMYIFERECCATEPTPGCSDSGQADGSLGGTSEEGAQRGILIDAIVNHASEVEIFLFRPPDQPMAIG